MKSFDLTVPTTAGLEEMSESEMAEYAKEHAAKLLATLPPDVKPIGVNRVRLNIPINAREEWRDWARACNDMSGQIDKFVKPTREDFGLPDHGDYGDGDLTEFESNLKTVQLTRKIDDA